MLITPRATVQDLYTVPNHGKAEIVNGELVRMSPTGARPGRAATKIAASLMRYEEEHGGGFAFGDNVGFLVNLPNRNSFSPDAAWYDGDVDSMTFLPSTPRFAVEVRSENDYGPAAEEAITLKFADYFAAGTLVMWDVDLLSDEVIKVYRIEKPTEPTLFGPGETAEAEPAVPGWRFPVALLFR